MNTYILTESIDEGIQYMQSCTASDIKDAIENGFKFSPWTLTDFIGRVIEKGRYSEESIWDGLRSEPIDEEIVEALKDAAREHLFSLFNVDGGPYFWEGNEVDGDSSSQRIILEVTPEGDVTAYPGGPIEKSDHDPLDF